MRTLIRISFVFACIALLSSCASSFSARKYHRSRVTVAVEKPVKPVTPASYYDHESSDISQNIKEKVLLPVTFAQDDKQPETATSEAITTEDKQSDIRHQRPVPKIGTKYMKRLEVMQEGSRWGNAIGSVVTGFLSALMILPAVLANFLIFAIIGGLLSILAIVFGIMGLTQRWKRSKWLAVIGLILGCVMFIVWMILIICVAVGALAF